MKIDSRDSTIGKLLGEGYFLIPRFQRPYEWERSHVEDFWNDTIVDADSDYFIGSVVLFKDSSEKLGIVDGQQRLTTITMTLCALRDAMQSSGFKDLAAGIHRLIERPDINNKNQFVVQSQTSYPFLQEHIQSFPTSGTAPTVPGEEERLLQSAFSYITEQVQGVVQSVRMNPSRSHAKQQHILERELLRIRDRVLRLAVIVIVLDSEEDAYSIFETLNTRGKDLTVSDLFRTHITRLLPQSNRQLDRPKERFNAIIENFEASAESISINSFLHHYWLSRYEYTTAAKLYKAMRKRIKTNNAASDLLESLEADAKWYRVIHEPEYVTWRIENREIRDSLRALTLFRVRQHIPFVLSVLREYADSNLSAKQTRRALRAVENFHFIFTAVTSQRSSGGISFMYAMHARQLREATSVTGRVEAIDELIQKLRDKLPAYQEFEADFREIRCSEKYTKRKSVVQYILTRMASKYLQGVSVAWEGMTIEHLANQKGSALSDDVVAMLGNLLVVSDNLNSKLGSKPFSQKMKVLHRHPVWLDEYLESKATSGNWRASDIKQRTDHLAKLAYENVWRF